MKVFKSLLVGGFVGLFIWTAPLSAQEYPAKPIRVVVPYAAGGPTDVIGRVLAPSLSLGLGQQVLIDNKPGAATLIGTRVAAQAAPDGYTLMMHSLTVVLNALAYKNPGYKMSDFVPVAGIISTPFVFSASSKLPVRNLAELIAYAKANPDKVNSVTLGPSSITTLSLERFKAVAGFTTTPINYSGSGPAITALISGVVDVFMDGAATTLAQAKSPGLRMMAITSATRSSMAPDVPTFKEQGYPAMVIPSWSAFFGPAGLPAPILSRVRWAVGKTLAEPEVRTRLVGMGLEMWTGKPEDFARDIAEEMVVWEKDVKRAGLQLE